MLNTVAVLFKVIIDYIKRRWAGISFLLAIVIGSTAFSSREHLPSYLNQGLYLLALVALLPFLKFTIDEFDGMVREISKAIHKRWLLAGEFQLKIEDSDTRKIIKRKVDDYVNRIAAKQEAAFQKWKNSLRLKQPKTQNRPIWMILSASVSGVVLWVISHKTGHTFAQWFDPKNSSFASLITLVCGLSVAYMVWLFRDQNNLWQIENGRKDVNLKDFQRLSELACGTHYPEDKVRDFSHEQLKQAAESLQVSAIYQLKEFMEGAYGSQFMRPTFLLLRSVWGGFVNEDQKIWTKWINELPSSNGELCDFDFASWIAKGDLQREKSALLFAQPLGLALQEVISGASGDRIKLNIIDIPASQLLGLNCRLPGMSPLQLANAKLNDIRLQGADLRESQFQGASLFSAELQGANLQRAKLHSSNLVYAQMQGANLTSADLTNANLYEANLNYANLSASCLIKTNLNSANLVGANLGYALFNKTNFRLANLTRANFRSIFPSVHNLKDSNFENADLSGADMRGCVINEDTQIKNCKIDLKTKFGTLLDSYPRRVPEDDDWINSDEIRQEWLNRGAIMV
jgi:uncharacterized protein YjbI with pentapeptide repeats